MGDYVQIRCLSSLQFLTGSSSELWFPGGPLACIALPRWPDKLSSPGTLLRRLEDSLAPSSRFYCSCPRLLCMLTRICHTLLAISATIYFLACVLKRVQARQPLQCAGSTTMPLSALVLVIITKVCPVLCFGLVYDSDFSVGCGYFCDN